jgi:DNA-binding CsgD family transcriptional regulator
VTGRRDPVQAAALDRAAMLTIIRNTPVPALLVDLPNGRIAAANAAVGSLLAIPEGESLLGRMATDLAADPLAGRRAMSLVLEGHIDGFWRANRLLSRWDGSTVSADIWFSARPADKARPRFGVVVGVPTTSEGSAGGVLEQSAHDPVQVVGVVGDAWLLRQISTTVTKLLGYRAEDLVGKSIIGFVHPEDVPALLMALGSAAGEPRMSPTHLRLLSSANEWTLCTVHISALAATDLPAFAFTARPTRVSVEGDLPRALDAHERLMRIAHEIRSLQVTPSRAHGAAAASSLALLSPRECEIVQLLLDGERVPAIAARLVVSQSTVRNHLAASFKKLGVHSQQELLRRFWT